MLRDVGTIVLGAHRVRMWTLVDGAAHAIADEPTVAALDDRAHPIAHVVATAQPLWLPLSQHAALVGGPNDPMRSACVLPLLIEGNVIGAVDFSFAGERRFYDEDREFFTAVAQHVADALDRTQLPEIPEWPTGSSRIETVVAENAKRVLIVDGDADAAEELRAAIEAMGHEAVVVWSGLAALTAAIDFHAHIAFVDLEMINGYETVAQLCKMPHWEAARFVPLRKPSAFEDLEAILA